MQDVVYIMVILSVHRPACLAHGVLKAYLSFVVRIEAYYPNRYFAA